MENTLTPAQRAAQGDREASSYVVHTSTGETIPVGTAGEAARLAAETNGSYTRVV